MLVSALCAAASLCLVSPKPAHAQAQAQPNFDSRSNLRPEPGTSAGQPQPGFDSRSNLWRPEPGKADGQPGVLQGAMVAATTAFEAAQVAERDRPGSVPPLELAGLQRRALAQKLRWAIAERDQQVGMVRFEPLDRVLADMDAAAGWLGTASAQAAPADQPAWRDAVVALQSDHLLGLVERGRAGEAVALYQSLAASGADLPPFALVAAAEAYAQERRSADAVPLYEAALRKQGDANPLPVEDQFGLIYAYLDVGRFEDADALLTRLETQTPALVRLTPTPGQPNAEYSNVVGMRAFYLLYTDRLAAAEMQFERVLDEAPFNSGFAEGSAETQRLRGHPRAALAQYEALSATYPYDRNIRAGRGQTLLDLNRFGEAHLIGESLATDYPDSTFLHRFERQERAATGAYLEVEGAAGRGNGNALADKSWALDSRLSSGLIADKWRVFTDVNTARGETDIGWSEWSRGSLGLSWNQGDLMAEGEIQRASTGPYRTSVAGRVSFSLSDQWLLGATFDGDTKDTPWKARAAGIGAREGGLNAAYIVNESRRFDAALQHMRYSDSNRRTGAAVSWRERLIGGPGLQLESLLSADTSTSRSQNVPYFSPDHDASVQAGLEGQYLTWKNDDRQFFQVAEISLGGYKQADFSTRSLWTARYGHRWTLGPKMELRYGFSIASHPYDGVKEKQRSLYINLMVPLS